MTFDRNDLPGVMLSTGAQRLTRLYGVKPGSRAVVVDVRRPGVPGRGRAAGRPGSRSPPWPTRAVAARAQSRPRRRCGLAASRYSPATFRHEARGRSAWTGLVVARLVDGRPGTEERGFDCDLVAMSGGLHPAGALLYQAGAASRYEESLREIVPAELPDGVRAAGGVTGAGDLPASLEQGRAAGLEAAAEISGTAGVRQCEPATRRSGARGDGAGGHLGRGRPARQGSSSASVKTSRPKTSRRRSTRASTTYRP